MPQRNRKRISQQEIARELGVSQALVSMVLNGRRSGISDASYNKIWEFARAHGYTPRGMNVDIARNNEDAPRTVGYILRAPLQLATKSNFFNYVHQGLHTAVSAADMRTVFLGSELDLDPKQLVRQIDSQSSLIGLVVMGEVEQPFIDTLLESRKPIVYASARYPGRCHSVISNQVQSADQIVEHLEDLGHKTFAWLGGDLSRSRHNDRKNAIVAALARHGHELHPRAQVDIGDSDRIEGYSAAKQIYTTLKNDLPTAWIGMTGLSARGAINFLLQQGIEVGRDISVATFDQTRVCTEENPTITGAFALPDKVGEEAGRILIAASQDRDFPLHEVTLPSFIETRESTGKPVRHRVRKPVDRPVADSA